MPRRSNGAARCCWLKTKRWCATVAEAMLTRLGFAVLQARDGVEAVEVFRQHQDEIRCVLCDLTMPRMNGWETLGGSAQSSRPDSR